MYLYIWKFISFLTTLFSMLVYNFHKLVKGIKTKRHIKYKKNGNIYNYLNVCFQKDKIKEKRPCIIYFHGGGWTCYSKSIYSTLCRRLANMGYVVFNANYSLAPKYKIDKILDDAISVIKYVTNNAEKFGGDASQIILAGDSAGAHISAMTAANVFSGNIDASEFKEKIKGLLLFYGVYDISAMMHTGFPNIKTYGKATFYGKTKDEEENFKYSPINFITKDYPPCFIASGEIDKLHKTQSKEFANKLEENNIKTDILFFRKKEKRAMHAYMIFDGLETNRITLDRVEEFLKGVTK